MEHQELESLLIKKAQKQLTLEEEVHLEQLLKQQPSYQMDEEVFEAIWAKTKEIQLDDGKSADQRWANLQGKLLQNDGRPKRKTFYYAAACVVFIAMLTVIVWPPGDRKLITAVGRVHSITLPDSSIVTLNSGGSLAYSANTFNDNREIELHGEAYFSVKGNKGPFIVLTDVAGVEVLGTTFNVRSTNTETSVSCLSGKVKVRAKPSNRSSILTKGKGINVGIDGAFESIGEVSANTLSWSTGELIFENTAIERVLEDVAHHYKIQIVQAPHLPKEKFTGRFRNETLDAVLETICLSAGLECNMQNDSTAVVK
ncbi:MAG: FecR domain-containing protein [Chryseolinea sp.]